MRFKLFITLTTAILALALSAAPVAAQAESEPAPTPGVELTPLTGVASVTTGLYHGCARLSSHEVRCWGHNAYGQLGNGDTTISETTVTVRNASDTGPLRDVTALASGLYHSCALLSNHQVRCWGSGEHGQLGNGNIAPADLPVTVLNAAGNGPLGDVVEIAAGGNSSCARLTNGQVRCWGDNTFRQLGNGTTLPVQSRPTAVRSVGGTGRLGSVTGIDIGTSTACARLANGQVRCWGDNAYGQLGIGSTEPQAYPVAVRNGAGTGPLSRVTQVSTGAYHTCAVRTDGTGRCWGYNGAGQLGDATYDERHLPVVVVVDPSGAPLHDIARLNAGYAHSCVRQTSGPVGCWGDNEYAQLGNGNFPSPDLAVITAVRNVAGTANLTGATQLDTSANHACVRLGNGQARCWGYDEYGGLGDGDTVDRILPVKVLA